MVGSNAGIVLSQRYNYLRPNGGRRLFAIVQTQKLFIEPVDIVHWCLRSIDQLRKEKTRVWSGFSPSKKPVAAPLVPLIPNYLNSENRKNPDDQSGSFRR